MQNFPLPSFFGPVSLIVFIQCLTRDLILSTKTASATERAEEDCSTHLLGTRFPIRAIEADSCDLDKYDMPVQSKGP